MSRSLVLAALIITASAFACGAFEDGPDQQRCHDIPDGGCPGAEIDGSLTANCADPTCAALYTCDVDGGWSLIATCPPHPHEAGAPDAAHGPDARRPGGELRDVAFDVPPGASGGPGCPDLQPTDCPLSLGLACPADECCCCQALFVCADGGWDQWGNCEEGGTLVPLSSP